MRVNRVIRRVVVAIALGVDACAIFLERGGLREENNDVRNEANIRQSMRLSKEEREVARKPGCIGEKQRWVA